MADKKISELTSITGANVDDVNDEIAIVDASATETKAITRAELFSSVASLSVDGNITVGGTVDGRQVSVDGSKLDGIEALADVTDAANVTAAGALMDSELADITAVKALNQGVATTDSPTFGGLDVNGTVTADTASVRGNVNLSASSTEGRGIEVGLGRTGNGNSFIDLIGDATYSDYGLRMIRGSAGANAASNIQHRGTGGLNITTQEAAAITLRTSNVERMRIDSSGNVTVTGAFAATSYSGDGVATQAEAEAGTNNDQLMTPLRTSQAIAALASGSDVSLLNFNYTAIAGQTSFSGADDNAATLSYTSQNIIVTLNGVVLEGGTDYTASDGTSIVLASGAAAGDELNIIAFQSFTVADTVPASTGGTFSGNVTVNGTLSATAFAGDGVSTQAEAEAGTNNDQLMTPLRTSQAIAALASGSAPPTQQVFTSSGTWTKPADCKTIKVTVTGGGGASGSTGTNYSGGGAAGTAIKYIDVTAVSSVSVTVGSGDTTRSATAGSGGTSSFGSYCSGYGGGRYNSNGTWKIGRGGGATGGDYNLTGQDGSNYYNDSRAVMPDAASFTGGYGDGGGGGEYGTSGIVIVEEFY